MKEGERLVLKREVQGQLFFSLSLKREMTDGERSLDKMRKKKKWRNETEEEEKVGAGQK